MFSTVIQPCLHHRARDYANSFRDLTSLVHMFSVFPTVKFLSLPCPNFSNISQCVCDPLEPIMSKDYIWCYVFPVGNGQGRDYQGQNRYRILYRSTFISWDISFSMKTRESCDVCPGPCYLRRQRTEDFKRRSHHKTPTFMVEGQRVAMIESLQTTSAHKLSGVVSTALDENRFQVVRRCVRAAD